MTTPEILMVSAVTFFGLAAYGFTSCLVYAVLEECGMRWGSDRDWAVLLSFFWPLSLPGVILYFALYLPLKEVFISAKRLFGGHYRRL
ncbi:hypothetical protein [Pseudomonas phage HZ2201]|nr:hypothetical protein [Pseudomonas phage HZ2201]